MDDLTQPHEQTPDQSSTSDPPIVALRSVSKSYGSTRDVLHDVTLDIARGEALAVVGPSGSGKSTLLNIIGALTPPTSGEVRVAGKLLGNQSDDELAQLRNTTIGFVFQSHHLLPQCTAIENVLIPSIVHKAGANRHTVVARGRELLDRVGLAHRESHKPGQMSGGECQRVAVARSLINQPQLLLADEPTGSLDEQTADELGALLAEINEERGVTLVTVTHARRLADQMKRQISLRGGRIETAIQA